MDQSPELHRLVAESDIRRVLALYVQRHDDHDIDGQAELFARNGRLVTGRGGEHAGREALKQFWSHHFAVDLPGRRLKLLLGASVIRVADGTAEAVSDVMVFQSLDDLPWVIRQSSRYYDKFVVEDGEWRILERRIESDSFRRAV